MGEQVKVELYKFFKNRKNLIIIAILILYTLIMVGYNHIQSTQYMSEMGRDFADRSEFSTSLSSTLKLALENNVLNGQEPELIEKRMEYYALEGRNLQVLGFFYDENKAKNYKYINSSLNKLYSSMLLGYDEGIIELEEIEKRGYTLREVKLLADYTKYLMDKDIQPILNIYEINGANSLKLFLSGTNLIIFFILISLLAADIYLKEMSEGSYKLLLTQPNKRGKVYISKAITISIVSITVILLAAIVNFTISSIIGGIRDFSYPLMSREALNIITTNGMDKPLLILPLWEFIFRGFILLLSLIIFTVMTILTISILTDSNKITLGLTIIIVTMSFGFNAFLSKGSPVNLWYPHSYLFIEDVLQVSNRSNYLMGIIICVSGGILSFILGYLKFVKKDFLGAVD